MSRPHAHVVAARNAERKLLASELRLMATVLLKNAPEADRARAMWRRQADRFLSAARQLDEGAAE